MNKLFLNAFFILGIVALSGALFFGATHHYWTAGLCLVICLVTLLDQQKELKAKRLAALLRLKRLRRYKVRSAIKSWTDFYNRFQLEHGTRRKKAQYLKKSTL